MPPSGLTERLATASGRDVSRETMARLSAYVGLLKDAAAQQNLISPSTLETIWERHILDSAQLLRFAKSDGAWVDIGSGAGLPGIVIAILSSDPITLIEPRRLRADFLVQTAHALSLSNVSIECAKVERVRGQFEVITARAVAQLDRLLAMADHLATSSTLWVLPKGRSAQSELAQAQLNWHCDALVEQSCTDPESQILVLTRVGAKKKR
ncbi:MAG TPA: 16S rRNA (guanine(527)-N(7))-methyltransferase RsmG [Sphingomicrobium sp.]|nr:16S rRNA (guanine(527)-N(7))-methyltransferase RsmG [Sphingomicrobium sp.]